MPPIAAKMGNKDFFTEDNSPVTISRLISIPARKKKMAIKKSLITREGELGRERKNRCA